MTNFNYNADYLKLLSIFFRVVQSSIEDFQELDECYVYAHALALKQYRHLSTIKTLCVPQYDEITGDTYVDHASIHSLTRSSLETFLTFAHLYSPENAELTRLRYAIWQRCGLMERQKLVPSVQDFDEQLSQERRDIDALKIEIEASPLFQMGYGPKQRKRLIEDGEWMGVNKMSLLATEARIHKNYFRNVYKHASGHSHASFISAMQVNQARDLTTQTLMATSCLGIGLFVMTHFLAIFVRMSPKAKETLNAEQEAKHLFVHWHIQEDDWEKLYIKKNASGEIINPSSNLATLIIRSLDNWRSTGQGYVQGSYGAMTLRFTLRR